MKRWCIALFCIFSTAYPSKKAIIIGASSGMGREVAKRLSKQGYTLGLCARRKELLESLAQELKSPCYIEVLDVTSRGAREQLSTLITKLDGLDVILISISAYFDNKNATAQNENDFRPPCSWREKERYLDVDGKAFIAMADVAFEYFKNQGHGHFVGISSLAGLRGHAYLPEYSAAKAAISAYMEAQRNYMIQNHYVIHVTEVIPGFIAVEHSPIGEDPAAFWEIPVKQAGRDIVKGINNKSKRIYTPQKVCIVSWVLRYLPDYVYNNYFPWI